MIDDGVLRLLSFLIMFVAVLCFRALPLASLVDGCRDEDSEGKMCENYFLFWIENHIMLSVDINRRIPTIMTKQQRIPSPFYLPHDFWLMRDFWNTSGCDRGRTRQAIEARDRL